MRFWLGVTRQLFLRKTSVAPCFIQRDLALDLNIYSFRIDRKWRPIFIMVDKERAEIVDINPHCR